MTNENFQYEQTTNGQTTYENNREQLKPASDYTDNDIELNKPKIYSSAKDKAFYIILVILFVLYFVIGILFFFLSIWAAQLIYWILFAIIVFLIIFCLIPRQIEVWNDSIKIQFYPMYKYTIPFNEITEIKIKGACDVSYAFCKLTTNLTGEKVEIWKKKNCVSVFLISPEDPKEFVSYVRYRMNPSSYMHPPAQYV